MCRLLECAVKDEYSVQFGLTHDISASHAVPVKVRTHVKTDLACTYVT